MDDEKHYFCPISGGHCPTRSGGSVYSFSNTMAFADHGQILNEGGHTVMDEQKEMKTEELTCRWWDDEKKQCGLLGVLKATGNKFRRSPDE